MGFELEWDGQKVLERIQNVAGKNVAESAGRVLSGAKKRVPKDLGTLNESIDVRKWKKKGVVGSFVEAGAPGEEHIANFVELGTPGDIYTGGAYKGQKRKPLPAQPYLRPALNEDKKKFVESFRNPTL